MPPLGPRHMEFNGLSAENNYEKYLDQLENLGSEYVVIIAIKEYAGKYCLGERLGAPVPLEKKVHHNLVIIREGRKIITMERGSKDLNVFYNPSPSTLISISCSGKKSGNYVYVVINGYNWAINKNGVNFVVFNKTLNIIEDAVWFETNSQSRKCLRLPPTDPFFVMENKLKSSMKKIQLDNEKTNIILSALINSVFGQGTLGNKNLFKSIPPSNGNKRMVQLAELTILSKIASVCENNNIEYWINFGTLIGAVRHGGFVPWDDDVDISMMKDEFDKFYKIIKESDELCIFVLGLSSGKAVYRVLLKDNIGPFVDVYTCEYSTNNVDIAKDLQIASGNQFISIYRNNGYRKGYSEYDDSLKEKIDRSVEESRNDGYSPVDSEDVKTIVYCPNQHETYIVAPKEYIFPLKKGQFENITVYYPNMEEKLLEWMYGDIYTLPDDLLDHRHLSEDAQLEVCKRIIDESNKSR